METRQPNLETRPPKVLEAIVEFLIPPAAREHVLGDLHERFRSPGQYAMDAARTAPNVIASRIRRTTDPLMLLAEGCVSYSSFFGAALLLVGMPFFTAWTDILRLSIPVFGALAMLALRDAYAYPETPLARNVLLDTAAAFAGVFLTHALLAVVMPVLALPRPVRVQGGLVSILALLLVRLNKPEPQVTTVVAGPQSGDALLEEARKFETRIRRRNLREYGAAAIVVFGFGRILWIGPQPLIRLGAALILAATAFVVYRIHTRGAAQPVPADARAARAVHRRAMEQQRDLLKSIWRWYLLPFVPGFLVLNIGTAIRNGVLFNQNATPEQLSRGVTTLFFIVPFLLMMLLMAGLNKRGASRLQQKIEALDATDHSPGE